MKENSMYRRMLLIVIGIVMFLINSNAQIEDFQVGTTTRKMLVYAPSGLKPNSPLLLSLHGMNQDIAYQQNQTKWELIAKDNGFVVVYPGGINNSWDISGTRDTDFMLAIINEMYKRYGIDTQRVYLSGFSMGGMFTYHAATKIADKIAAFAPVSGYLMGGPNTNSSRPIPIIHVHGTIDDVVDYSGVQTSLNAWIARNNCPTTAIETNPYPVNKPSSNGTLYYWGPGTDSVEVVHLKLFNVGHWHSIEPTGVNTSLEIWNFCKKYTLDYGIPKYKYASVTDSDPKKVEVTFTLPIEDSLLFNGFTVEVDGNAATIDSVKLSGENKLAVYLSDSILNSNEVYIAYGTGNVYSTYNKKLLSFNEKLVDNLLKGSAPRITETIVSYTGDSLIIMFNKKLQLPTDLSTLSLSARFTDTTDVSLENCAFADEDSTKLVFELGKKVYADYKLLLTYTGSNIASVDTGYLKTFADFIITNNSKGLPVQMVSGALESNAMTIALQFTKPVLILDEQISQINIKVNDAAVTVKEVFALNNEVRFVLNNNLYYGDLITVSYTPGDIAATDKGDLEAFTGVSVENPLNAPTWIAIPGKIEAENFTMQYGIDTETTSDVGGGLNIGWTDPNDWLVYAIENNTDDTEFEILFRTASNSNGARFEYYVGNEKNGFLMVINTSGWQNWRSSDIKKITIPKGQSYLKFLTTGGGYNLNYFEIQKEFLGQNDLKSQKVVIYPNPVSSEMVILSPDFQYKNIEIMDIAGRLVYSNTLDWEPEMHIQTTLSNGSYLVRLSNNTESQIHRIVVVK